MMYDIMTIFKRELTDVKSSIKKLLLLFLLLVFMSVYISFDGNRRPGFPMELAAVFIPVICSLLPLQLFHDTFTAERGQRTLEIILTRNIKKESIIIGKALLAFILGVIFAYSSMVITYAFLNVMKDSLIIHFTPEMFVILAALTLCSTCITFVVLAVMKSTKITPQASLVVSLGSTMGLMYLILKLSLLDGIFKTSLTILGLVILSVLAVLLAAKLLKY